MIICTCMIYTCRVSVKYYPGCIHIHTYTPTYYIHTYIILYYISTWVFIFSWCICALFKSINCSIFCRSFCCCNKERGWNSDIFSHFYSNSSWVYIYFYFINENLQCLFTPLLTICKAFIQIVYKQEWHMNKMFI